MSSKWSDEFPAEPGRYWFYGFPQHGTLGEHWWQPSGDYDAELVLVRIYATSDGLVGVGNGDCIYPQKFDRERHKIGWLGWWHPAEIPVVPQVEMIGDVEIASQD